MQIFLHELRLVLREPRFWIPFLFPPVLLIIMQIVILSQYGVAGHVFEPKLLMTVGGLLATISVTLTADSFAGERERNTLELLLCLPITLRQLFFGKLFALLPVPLVLSGLALTLLWVLSHQDLDVLIKSLLFSASLCLLITGISLQVSLFAQTVRSAAQANVLFVLVFLVLTQMVAEQYLATWFWPLLVFPVALLVFAGLVMLSLQRFQKMN